MKVDFSITGIILAGGKSSRMKCEKAFLKLGSKTIIEELISRLKKKFPQVIIIANDTRKYAKFGTELASDILPEKGPLGGIYTGLVKSDSFYNFVFACDMPFINPDLIDYMVDRRKSVDIVVPRWQGKFEPLCAIYSKRCIGHVKTQLEKNDLKITNLFSHMNINVIEQEAIEKLNLGPNPFLNINTKEDYNLVEQRWI